MDLLEPIAVAETAGGYEVIPGAEVDVETGAVTVDGERIQDAMIVTRQYLPLYPQAAGLHRAWPWRARQYKHLFDCFYQKQYLKTFSQLVLYLLLN